MTTPRSSAGISSPGCRAPGVPEREMRLLVDGIREWLGSLAGEGSTRGHLGVLEGEPGQGQSEVLRALTQVCRDLGLCALHGRASRTAAVPPGTIGTPVEHCLRAYHKQAAA